MISAPAALLAGLLVAGAAGFLVAARRLRWLTAVGATAAVLVGAAVLLGAGAGGLALLALFFASASALTTWNPARRTGEAGDAAGRGARQVVANGGVAALAALLGLAGVLPLAHYAVAGALAAAMADTWATEVGTAIGGPTRRIGTWERVPPGRSGGISAAGTAAGVGGALLLGLAAAYLVPAGQELGGRASAGAAVTAAGILGMTVDSLVGGHLEGRVGGLDNHTVNLVGTASGAAAAWVLAILAAG